MRHSICLIAFRQSRIPAVDLVSDPPTQLSTSSRGAEPSSESAASLILDLLHGTVFHTISIKSVTLVFSSAASKLNYFLEHTSLVVSAPGRSVNSAIEMTVLLLLLLSVLVSQQCTMSELRTTRQVSFVCFKIISTCQCCVNATSWGYCGSSPTAVQAWQTCPLWEPSPSHPILV